MRLKVGKIVNTHSLKGEVKVISSTDFEEERFKKGSKLLITRGNQLIREVVVQSYRNHKNFLLVKFEGIDSVEDAEKLKKVNKGDLVIARTSENIDDVMKTVAYLGEKTVVAGGHSTIFRHKENPKYLSYVLNGADYAIKQKNKMARGVKVIELSTADMEKIKIPLPSLQVQEYIVSILDKFDTLVNDIKLGLPKEIEERQKQYEYYRERLLSFKKS